MNANNFVWLSECVGRKAWIEQCLDEFDVYFTILCIETDHTTCVTVYNYT